VVIEFSPLVIPISSNVLTIKYKFIQIRFTIYFANSIFFYILYIHQSVFSNKGKWTTSIITLYLHVDWCVIQETAIIYPGTVWIFNTRVNPPVLFTVNYFNLSNQIICSNVQRIILKEKKTPTNITTTSLSTNVKKNQIFFFYYYCLLNESCRVNNR
jgi:hypothetical protein